MGFRYAASASCFRAEENVSNLEGDPSFGLQRECWSAHSGRAEAVLHHLCLPQQQSYEGGVSRGPVSHAGEAESDWSAGGRSVHLLGEKNWLHIVLRSDC